MKKGSTLFLKSVIYLIGLLVLGLCIILVGVMIGGTPGPFVPMMLVMLTAGIPFFYGLWQALLLLSYIEKDVAFSVSSVQAIRTFKYCAFSISALYALGMPLIIYAAHVDDAPGVVLLGLVFIFAPLVTGVFAAVLERLFNAGLEMKSENELTV